ncbi:MAG: ABC transporter ATP-binding protein [Candidatus Marinimicrobia bacterium]|nr:ABC transporter ATP-binding protein [Candidatus Neomarinimicrobiota bacterium]MCF7922897.1 ABC transporter ATP-binding protein [Candidatus Neomarinimicrobiota bacterium]
MNPILQVIDINKSFSGVGERLDVLKNVNLSLERGEIVAINGPSGIGKTTLLNIIGTLDKADSGELLISGKSPAKMNDEALSSFRAANLGYIFQFHYLLPEFTALENVLIPAKIIDLDKELANERAKTLLEAVGVYERRHHKPSQLSGGERQRVAVARALMNRPELVLADEPTGNLDPDNGKRLVELIQSVRKEFDQSFLIATHSRSLSSACDRVISLT